MSRSVSDIFGLGKTQGELDFVDVNVDGDIRLFVDPFAISVREDPWSVACHGIVVAFFQKLVDLIRAGDHSRAREMLRFLREPNETRLGFSRARPRGAGIGRDQADGLLQALAASSAVRTGFISALEEAELMVEGIGPDKISDLTTNVIRIKLVEYTQDQCSLHAIPMDNVPLPPHWDPARELWVSGYHSLPVAAGRPLLLIPKWLVRLHPAYNQGEYYRHYVLSFLQSEHLAANTGLVHTLKDGRRGVYKKEITAHFPGTKENLFQFSKDHPEVLRAYRDRLEQLEREGLHVAVGLEDERLIAKALQVALASIPVGQDGADDYHKLMVGVVEFLFYPMLVHPRGEVRIHDGRKRIDITMENGDDRRVFYRLHHVQDMVCTFVAFECKNYVGDPANPELDQLSGRFAPHRGRIGFLCCRQLEDRELFVKRCQDTYGDDRGLIVPLDDTMVVQMLEMVAEGNRAEVEGLLGDLFNEIRLT